MKLRHSTIPFLFVLSAILPSLLPAVCRADKDPANSIASGSFAVQFLTFGGGYQQPFSTSGIFMKAHLSDRGALRVGTTFNLDQASSTNPLAIYQDTGNDRSYAFTVSSEYEYYADETGPVTFFVGFGPYWRRARNMYERTLIYDATSGAMQYYNDESRAWEVGGAASMGLEWFFKRKLSLLARVGASFGFGQRHDSHFDRYFDGFQYHESRARRDSNTSTAGTSAAELGLSIYL